MERPKSISQYLTAFATELGQRILESFPPLYGPEDRPSPLLAKLLRRPFPSQAVSIHGIVKRLSEARSAAVVAECGAGKTLISLASLYIAARGKPFTALVMVPPNLTVKWAREAIVTIPQLRVFLIDGLRNANSSSPNGIHEVKLRNGRVVREGFVTTLTDLRLRKNYPSARAHHMEPENFRIRDRIQPDVYNTSIGGLDRLEKIVRIVQMQEQLAVGRAVSLIAAPPRRESARIARKEAPSRIEDAEGTALRGDDGCFRKLCPKSHNLTGSFCPGTSIVWVSGSRGLNL